MSLVFVRHGETALNVAQIVQPADTPLNRRGRLQAERLADRLAGLAIEAIVSSDLPRALETARCIGCRTGLPVEIDPIWRERNFGDWRGRRWLDLGFDPRTTDRLPPRGETPHAFAERVALAFAGLLKRERQGSAAVVIVTHGLVIRHLLEAHLGRAESLPPRLHLGNTSVTVAARQPPHAISVLDCVAHLSQESLPVETAASGL